MIENLPPWLDPDELGIPTAEAAEILGVEEGTLATWRSQGRGPRFRKIGRRVEYTPRFVREYQNAKVQSPVSASVRRQQRALTALSKS
jgi:hypothetical protein